MFYPNFYFGSEQEGVFFDPFGSIWVQRGSAFRLALVEGEWCDVVKWVLTLTCALTEVSTPRDYMVEQQQVPKTEHNAHVTHL